jgi:hypothetical protein
MSRSSVDHLTRIDAAPGRDELARMLFALAGEPFEFISIADDRNWGVYDATRDVKRTTPFGRVPILVRRETRTAFEL